MASLKGIVMEWRSGRQAEGGGRVHLAAFGKHPAWADHFGPLGSLTEVLDHVMSLLERAVRENVNKGTWEAKPQQTIPFGHLFLWRREQDIVAGRMWYSMDTGGRDKFPMTVCAHAQGLSVGWVTRHVLTCLAEIETACRKAERADVVHRCLADAQQQLQGLAQGASAETSAADGQKPPDPWAGLLGLGLDRDYLDGIVQYLDARTSEDAPRTGGKNRVVNPVAARVVIPVEHAAEALLFWTDILVAKYGKDRSILVLVPREKAWADIFLGEPTSWQLRCLRLSPAGLSLTGESRGPIATEPADRGQPPSGDTPAS